MPHCAGDEPDIIDGKNLRRLALGYKVPIITTVAGARATTAALKGLKSEKMEQVPLQDYFPEVCCAVVKVWTACGLSPKMAAHLLTAGALPS